MKQLDTNKLKLQPTDVEIIIKALQLYNLQIGILNAELFSIPEDCLSDINNDAQYISSLISHLKNALSE
jgi:hypothetical protein